MPWNGKYVIRSKQQTLRGVSQQNAVHCLA
jgi:hypothetical protein